MSGVAAVLLAGSVSAGAAFAAPQPLPDSAAPDARIVLPPPPVPGSAAQQDDDRVFHATRALKGTPRWDLAVRDADLEPAHLVADFSCAVGHTLDLTKAPHLQTVLARLEPATIHRTSEVKDFWHRTRPFVGTSLPICTPFKGLGLHSSYPSGHTTAGFGMALLLAHLMPEHATAILQRGRVFGESRVVCGVHWKSDVQAGYLNASTEMDTLLADPAIQDDLAAAKQELEAQLATPNGAPDAGECKVEADAAAHSVLSAQ
ncbi:phosphatase PAP2 family protein [Neokomagataea tanensis]|uniref:Acid phosphatase n=2 Tax=Neokomagataea TaxID=1223423 RepID=A0A4Y6V6U5_9PROT|nr:phosphatase PAP2 family protein [Neokomagataea tanensis]